MQPQATMQPQAASLSLPPPNIIALPFYQTNVPEIRVAIAGSTKAKDMKDLTVCAEDSFSCL